MSVVDDDTARREALDTTQSIILQAPAGSGKTTILVQRFLALLATVDAPESVLAMTFTRKAAAEMRSRILEAIEDADSSTPPRNAVHARTRELAQLAARHAVENGWQLERNPSRLRILTIDGLNRQLAAATPIAAGGIGDFAVIEHPERLLREVARATLIDAERDPKLRAHSDTVLRHLGNRWIQAENLIADMLMHRGRWLRHLMRDRDANLREITERNLEVITAAEIAAAIAVLGPRIIAEGARLAALAYAELAGEPTDSPRGKNASAIAGADRATEGGAASLRALANFALTGKKIRKQVNAANGFPKDSPHSPSMKAWLADLQADERLLEALLVLRDLPEVTFDAAAAATIDALVRVLEHAAIKLVQHFATTGRTDYVAIAAAARGLFAGDEVPSELVLHQGERLRHLLIDEFQDTSLDQIELLAGLTREWTPGDGRTLFVVGDPMQSIYQFRDAEVGLFLDVRERGLANIKLRSLRLTRNFRSQQPIVDFVNATFGAVFPTEDAPVDGAVRYLPCIAAAESDPRAAGVHWHVFDDDAQYATREAARVVDLVRRARSEAAEASVAVLIGARDHAREIVRALRAANFAVRGVDLLPLRDAPVVQELMALARALHSPADRLAWLAVLRAPWCGVTLQDLTTLVHGAASQAVPDLCADDARLARLSAEGRMAIERLFARLAPWRASEAADPFAHESLARRVEAAWLRVDGASCHVEATAIDDARRFLDTFAAEIAAGEWRSPDDFDAMLDGLYAASEAANDAVQVMTIHRAKGLEFDCVILPGLGRKTKGDQARLLEFVECIAGEDATRRLVMAPVSAADAAPSSLSKWLSSLRTRRARRERMRVLYVAATRARRTLHCCGALATRANGLEPVKGSPLHQLWPAIGDAALAAHAAQSSNGLHAANDAPVAKGPRGEAATLHRLPVRRTSPRWPTDVLVQRLPLSSGELAVGSALDVVVAGELARAVGVVVHRELERCVTAGSLPTIAAVHDSRERYAHALRGEGIVGDEVAAGAERVVAALQRTLEDERGRWVLARRDDDRVEWALTGLYEGVISSIVMDRCFVEDDVRWVIDYKTSRHEGADLEQFLLAQAERYRPQLRRYAAFARRLGPQPVRTALYFPLLGRFVEVDAT